MGRAWDTSGWALFAAYDNDMRIGGAVVVPSTDGSPSATLWDLRVRPAFRGMGVGSALFAAAERWCRQRGAAPRGSRPRT
jgi:GNAT superfamily N-acetyltransferase